MRAHRVLAGLMLGLGLLAPVSAAANPSANAAATIGDGYTALTPTRLLDTRITGTRVHAGDTVGVVVAGAHGVPAAADAAVLTVTATNPVGAGFVTVFPCGRPVPLASNVNVLGGQTVPNLVTASIGQSGRVCLYTSVTADIVVDLSGYYGSGGAGFATVVPSRIVDTRLSAGKVGAGTVFRVHVAGSGGVPATGATAVALNLTVTKPEMAGFATAYPCGTSPPLASNVDYAAGADASDAVVVGVGSAGDVCVLSSARTHLVIDLTGWFGSKATGQFAANDPRRLLDTRVGRASVPAGGSIAVPTGIGKGTAMLNVTVTGPRQAGFVTAYPCDEPVPNTSTLNFAAGSTVANAAAVVVDAKGSVCFFASSTTDLVVDLDGSSSASQVAGGGVPGAERALAWGMTQIGAPYAAINPYRFGDSIYGKPWDCPNGEKVCTRVDMHGTPRTIAAGTYVYDCSGFAVAAWLQGGVDLVKKEAAWTDVMYENLPHISRAQALPGDLVLFGPNGNTTDGTLTSHVGLYLDATHMLNAGAGCAKGDGVCMATIDWSHVVAIARVW
jgi:hypothetical protein